MYTIHGIAISSNTTKTIYVAEALGADYEFIPVDFSKAEHKSPEHKRRHPLGKVPTLTHNGKSLFESNAICSYMARDSQSSLYPAKDIWKSSQVDQWLAFFTNHLGRWLATYWFETFAKTKYGFGTPNEKTRNEAKEFVVQQMPVINEHLANNTFFLKDDISIADYAAFAYFEHCEPSDISLDDFSALKEWYVNLNNSDVIDNAHEAMGISL